jgi:Dockerin type I domain/WD40-like Beta Propeller Repeat
MRRNFIFQRVVFTRLALALVLCSVGGLLDVLSVAASGEPAYTRPGRTERVSVASDGSPGNGSSGSPSISADGRYVAFDSTASNLVPNDSNNASDVFVHDRVTGSTERISIASDGTQSNGDSWSASISDEGRYVAFTSTATNLVPGDTNAAYDVFVYDRQTKSMQRVSVASDGTQSNGDSQWAKISGNGNCVAFGSFGSNLVQDDTNAAYDIFVHNLQTGVTERVSVASDGSQFSGDSQLPAIDGDGGLVVFASPAINGAGNNDNDFAGYDVFVHDLRTGVTQRVSVTSNGTQGLGYSYLPAISADGRHVAFTSAAANLVPGKTTQTYDIFVHDLQTGVTERVSVSSDGAENGGDSGWPSLSADGRYVAFYMSPSSSDIPQDVYVHEMVTGTTELVSKDSKGNQGDLYSQWPSISADGRFVAFESYASNLVVNGPTDHKDVYVHDRGASLGVIGDTVTRDGNTLSVSGWATFSGAVISVATKPAGDMSLQELGADLVGASLTYRPESADLLVGVNLASLPGASGVGLPEVLYALRFVVAGAHYELRASRSGTGADFALFQCDPACVQLATLTGGIGTTGTEALISLARSALDISEGATLTQMQAFTALGDVANGAVTPLDQIDLPDAIVPAHSVSFGVAPVGVSESGVTFNIIATLDAGNFTGSGDVPPNSLLWGRACLSADCSPAVSWPMQLTSVVSRKVQGGAGTYDVDLTNGDGIEPRSGSVPGNYTLIFTFANTLTRFGAASIASGAGSIASSDIDHTDAHKYIMNLTGVGNAQRITVSLANATDSAGNSSLAVSGSMGVLIGDVNGDGQVDSSDLILVKQQTLQPVNDNPGTSNFREDVNTDGNIDSSDLIITKQQTLTGLPPAP